MTKERFTNTFDKMKKNIPGTTSSRPAGSANGGQPILSAHPALDMRTAAYSESREGGGKS